MPEQGFTLSSPAFSNGEYIPLVHSCDGRDVSPELEWFHPPEGTRSFALVVEDPDAPDGLFTHWMLYDLPASVDRLPEGGGSDVGSEGRNDFEEEGWGGPCPPPRHGDHRYYFRLHALDVERLELPDQPTRQQFDAALEGHVLESTQLMGRFKRD